MADVAFNIFANIPGFDAVFIGPPLHVNLDRHFNFYFHTHKLPTAWYEVKQNLQLFFTSPKPHLRGHYQHMQFTLPHAGHLARFKSFS